MTKALAGRPSSFRPEYVKLAKQFALLGATDKQMASFFEVSEQTLNEWKKKHPEFLESLKEGKIIADSMVASSLFHRALGYSHDEDDIRVVGGEIAITPTKKHYPPDTTACIYWLNNRQRQAWKAKVEDSEDSEQAQPVQVSVGVEDAS